jgi:hypothetical protein
MDGIRTPYLLNAISIAKEYLSKRRSCINPVHTDRAYSAPCANKAAEERADPYAVGELIHLAHDIHGDWYKQQCVHISIEAGEELPVSFRALHIEVNHVNDIADPYADRIDDYDVEGISPFGYIVAHCTVNPHTEY